MMMVVGADVQDDGGNGDGDDDEGDDGVDGGNVC